MAKNVGGTDRTVRIVAGLVSVGAMMVTVGFGEALGVLVQGIVAITFLIAAFVLLGTAAGERCPVNRVLGRNTYVKRDRR